MKQLEHIDRLVLKHRKEKRKKQLLAGCIGAGLLVIVGISILLIKSPWKKAPDTVPAVAVTDTEAASDAAKENKISDTTLTVSLAGDCTLGTDQNFSYDTSLNAYYQNYGADYFLSNVKSIFEADDLSIVNLEGPLTTSTERNGELYAFKGDPDFVNILTAGSVEAVNVANNHSYDYGEQGFSDTQSTLKSAGITSFGYDDTAVIDVKNVKIGLVGIYELRDHLERTQQLKDLIAKVKSEGADLIIVIFHWGNERDTLPDSNQITLGHMAIDYGADLVAGHHAHVLQGIEDYRGKKIVYGLGNFCFGGNSSPSDMDTMIFQQTFTFHNGEILTDDVSNIIPCRISSEWTFNNYQPTPATGDEAERILNKIQERSEQISASNL